MQELAIAIANHATTIGSKRIGVPKVLSYAVMYVDSNCIWLTHLGKINMFKMWEPFKLLMWRQLEYCITRGTVFKMKIRGMRGGLIRFALTCIGKAHLHTILYHSWNINTRVIAEIYNTGHLSFQTQYIWSHVWNAWQNLGIGS